MKFRQQHGEGAGNMDELDEIVSKEANGCYTIPRSKDAPKYKVKQLYEYAVKAGKNTSELTAEELKMFEIPKKQGQDQVTKLEENEEIRMLSERLEGIESRPESAVNWRDIRRSGGD